MKLVITSAVFGALFLISGCATQCESLSEQYNTCTFEAGERNRTVKVDGANFCGTVDALNARTKAAGSPDDCAALWKAHLDCWNGNMANICNIDDTTCDDSAAAWGTCIDNYCATIDADPNGYDPQCDSGASLIPSPFQSGF